MQYFWSYKWFTQQLVPENSYYSAMPWATGLKFYYVIADPKVAEFHIFKCKMHFYE